MRMRSKAAACAVMGIAALATTGCGSGDDDGTTVAEPPRIPAQSAARLAGLSNRIAEELDAGDVCTAAQHADDLANAVERASLPDGFSEVETVATDLVNQVNCPPPPEPEKKKKDEKKKEEGGGEGDDYESAVLGELPPGQAKKIQGD